MLYFLYSSIKTRLVTNNDFVFLDFLVFIVTPLLTNFFRAAVANKNMDVLLIDARL